MQLLENEITLLKDIVWNRTSIARNFRQRFSDFSLLGYLNFFYFLCNFLSLKIYVRPGLRSGF